MAKDGERYSPGAVAQRLGLGASTLRIYSVKLADVLSPGAGRPRIRNDGRPGVRTYSAGDVALLGRAKELLAKGQTYEEVAAELSGRRGSAVEGESKTRRNSAAALGGVLAAVNGALERAMAATEGWQRLAEERERDVLALRGRIERLEGLLDARRDQEIARAQESGREEDVAPWWRRLLS